MQCSSCPGQTEKWYIQTAGELLKPERCTECGSLWLLAMELEKLGIVPMEQLEATGDKGVGGCLVCTGSRLEKAVLKGAGGPAVDRCSACAGLWLDASVFEAMAQSPAASKDGPEGALERVVRDVGHPLNRRHLLARDAAASDERYLQLGSARRVGDTDFTCPACRAPLADFEAFGVRIDGCESCGGFWADRDEFHMILEILKDRLLREFTSEDMKNKVYEEIRELWDGPENAVSEIAEAKAAVAALVNIKIFEHPTLGRALKAFSTAMHSTGL